MTLWAKQGLVTDERMLAFTTGADAVLDNALIPYDLVGSAAHARGLEQIGILPKGDADALVAALRTLAAEWSAGTFRLGPGDEDCHSAIERELIARLGEAGKKIHAGRSRNDQVLTALRLLLRERLLQLAGQVAQLGVDACDAGAGAGGILMPGYSHGQRAMPSSLAFWYASFAEAWADQLDAAVALDQRIDMSPLGAAAGFGVPLPLDRDYTAGLMGFSRVQVNAAAVQNSRGRLEAAVLNWLVEAARDVEKMAQDLWLFSTAEFGFVRLDEALTTGSSLMPNKRNPDVLELLRATPAVILASRNEVEAVIAKLSSNYHRDFQLTKPPLFRGLDAAGAMFAAARQVIPALKWDKARMAAACTTDLFATQRAMDLVRQGVAFRDAYRRAAEELAAGNTKQWKAGAAALGEASHQGSPGNPGLDGARARLLQTRGTLERRLAVLRDKWNAVLDGRKA